MFSSGARGASAEMAALDTAMLPAGGEGTHMPGSRRWRLHVPHWFFLLTVSLICSAAWPSMVLAVQGNDDYDCVDFDSREDAQVFYEDLGGPLYDPFNLDDDEDGLACEEWVRDYERTAAGEDGVNGLDGIDMDCVNFTTPANAQRYFLEDGGSVRNNVDHLDPNHNGIACEAGEPG